MANHKSAKKRIRQTARRHLVNQSLKTRLKSLEKNLHQLIEKKDKQKALKSLNLFNKEMDQSVLKGLYHKNKVCRKKSRLSALVNAVK